MYFCYNMNVLLHASVENEDTYQTQGEDERWKNSTAFKLQALASDFTDGPHESQSRDTWTSSEFRKRWI